MSDIKARLEDVQRHISEGKGSVNLRVPKHVASMKTIIDLANGGFYVIENTELAYLLNKVEQLDGKRIERITMNETRKALKVIERQLDFHEGRDALRTMIGRIEQAERDLADLTKADKRNEQLEAVVEAAKDVKEMIENEVVLDDSPGCDHSPGTCKCGVVEDYNALCKALANVKTGE